MQNGKNRPWTKEEDELFHQLVAQLASPEEISASLTRQPSELKRRAYDIGLPLKWFKGALKS